MPASPVPIQLSAGGIDLSPRVTHSAVVVGSPAAAAETIVASITIGSNFAFGMGVLVFGYAAYTVGTNGTAVNLRIRQTDTSGAIVKASGAVTSTAANLAAGSIMGLDAAPVLPGQIYVLTMTVTAGSATSTVSAVTLAGILL